MDKSIGSEVDQHGSGLFKENLDPLLRVDPLNMAQWLPIHQGHDDGMPVGVDGCWGLEVVLVEELHEQELSDRR